MGGGLRHALMWGATATLVAGGLALLSPPPAVAVSSGRPVAVAVAADGTSYVGFPAGDRLLRLAPGGAQDGSIPLDRSGAVTALAVAPDDHVWVDYGDSVSELDPAGELLTHFPLQPAPTCSAASSGTGAHGGIEVTAGAVYVAGRCSGTVGVYDHSGGLRGTIDLPGSAYPRGVAFAKAADGVPARLYVAVPGAGKVYAYNASGLTDDPSPNATIAITKDKPAYGTPVPGAIAADAKGQLAVVDVANNAIYLYNGTNGYRLYRTLGHPPDPAPDRGYLVGPSALDQGASGLGGDLWVADTGNGRVQRWDTGGTTHWMSDTLPPGDPDAPTNTAPPEVSGAPTVGSLLTCDHGSWTPTPAAYAVSWLRDGVVIAGSTAATHEVVLEDVGTELACAVIATSKTGAVSAPAVSETVLVPGVQSPPSSIEPPVMTGTAEVGEVLHCTTGTWTGPTPTSYVRGWLRDRQLLVGTNAADYLVTANDVSHQLTCRVAAANAHGTSRPALSAPVTVIAGSGGSSLDVPEDLVPPRIIGQADLGTELFCDPGHWSDAPLFTYQWRRDGTAIAGATADVYTVAPADQSHRLLCLVTGTNPAGSGQAASAAVVVPGDDPGTTKTCRGEPSVEINNGDQYARSPFVTLRIRVPAGATGVTISNDKAFAAADTKPLSERCRYPWTLPSRSSRVPRTVWVSFPGAGGRTSDRIVLDSAAPVLRSATAHWSNPRRGWVVQVHASDRGTGLASVTYGRSRKSNQTVRWGRDIVSWDSGWLRWFQVRDRAGNLSRWYKLTGI